LRRYAPIVAADPPDGLVIDTTGADHLHGGEAAMLTETMVEIGSPHPACTRRACGGRRHLGRRPCAGPLRYAGRRRGSLQVRQLQADPAFAGGGTSPARGDDDRPVCAARLRDNCGSRRLTPRASLALRFGPEPGRRLDQAFARVKRTDRADPAGGDRRSAPQCFAEPIGAAETIARYTASWSMHSALELETRGLGARRLDLLFFRVDNRVEAIRVGTGNAGARSEAPDPASRATRSRPSIPGFGIELMRLAATVAEPLRAKQTAFPRSSRRPNRTSRT
jgi:protein ImuB